MSQEEESGDIDLGQTFPGVDKFVFDTPLYETFELTRGDGSLFLFQGNCKVDGYCPWCQTRRVFTRSAGGGSTNWSGISDGIDVSDNSYRVIFYCAMKSTHTIDIFLKVDGSTLSKIGQHPSLADITNDEAKTYRRVLDEADQKELSRAVGLASHGIGVGSFVYLRRVFERLIQSRYGESGLIIEAFETQRMEEKVRTLKDHLPPFLVSNKSIYGILSKGIHELTEEECLSFYDVLHESILIILEEDKRKRDDEARRVKLSKAISQFGTGDLNNGR
jgi:hypothetical protein